MRPIDADALLENVKCLEDFNIFLDYIDPEDVKNAPTIESRTEGIWQHYIYRKGNYWQDIPTICSECGHKYTEYVCGYEWEETGDLPNFCPNCGIKMRAETDEELKIRREQFKEVTNE